MRSLVVDSDGSFNAAQLRRFERGLVHLDESRINAVCRVYGTDLGAILPSGFLMSIEGGVITAGGVRMGFSPEDPRSLLDAYLRLIRALRNQKRAPAIALRRDDIEALAQELGVSGAEVVDRLTLLMGATAEQRLAMTSLFAAGAMVIGLAVFAGLSIDDAASAQAARPNVVTSSSVEVTHALAAMDAPTLPAPVAIVATPSTSVGRITTMADTAALMPATRLQVPTPTAPASVAAAEQPAPVQVVNRSGCNPGPGSSISVVIPEISYNCPVYAGGQAQIDAGFVTLMTVAGADTVLTTVPGAPGTLWLAGHRSTHGGAFADVPLLTDGATIAVADGTHAATYRVVSRRYVQVRKGLVVDAAGQATEAATLDAIVGDGDSAPRLLLQTCDGVNFRWLVYAVLVTD